METLVLIVSDMNFNVRYKVLFPS